MPPQDGNVLSGTKLSPTYLGFSLTRGFSDASQVGRRATTSGLHIVHRQTTIESTESTKYEPGPSHIVEFHFQVLPALHVETTTETLSTIQLAATIFSLIASAAKMLRLIKRHLAMSIDSHLLKRTPVPEDVRRRAVLLHEDNLMQAL